MFNTVIHAPKLSDIISVIWLTFSWWARHTDTQKSVL